MGNNKIPNDIVRISRYRKRLVELTETLQVLKAHKSKTGYEALIYEEDIEYYQTKVTTLKKTIKKLTDKWNKK